MSNDEITPYDWILDVFEPTWPNEQLESFIPEQHRKIISDLMDYLMSTEKRLHRKFHEREVSLIEHSLMELNKKMCGEVNIMWFGGMLDYVFVIPDFVRVDCLDSMSEGLDHCITMCGDDEEKLDALNTLNKLSGWWSCKACMHTENIWNDDQTHVLKLCNGRLRLDE